MTHLNRWKLAVAAAALAFAGTTLAQAQPSTGAGQAQDPARSQQQSGTEKPGERSGQSGTEANRAGTSTAGEQRTDTSRSARAGETRSGQAGQPKVDKGLQKRLEKIHASNQAELQMAQLAQQQAQSPEVKQFAEMIQSDHQKMDQKLQELARSAGYNLEGESFQEKRDDARKDMKKLQAKSGADFDKEFMSHMVKGHKSDVKEVQKAAKDAKKANQTELASMLDQAARGMQGHLEHGKRLEDQVKKSGQQAQGRRGQSGAERSPTAPGATGSGAAGGSTSPGAAGGTTSPGASTGSGSSADRGSAQHQGESATQQENNKQRDAK